MRALRSFLFNILFVTWTAFLSIVAVPLGALFFPKRAIHDISLIWSGLTFFLLRVICGIDYEIRGQERLPHGPCIVASKHQSAWDTMIFAHLFHRPSFVLKKELTQIPFFGKALLHAGMIPVDRSGGAQTLKAMVATARHFVAQGRSIVIFPEGTRVSPGSHLPYHPGVAALYGQLDLPVVPIALNSGLFWGRRSFIKWPGRIVLEILPPIPPGLPRRQFAAQLEQQVEEASNRLAARNNRLRRRPTVCG